ncbi:MAG TPA: response regulator [Acidobacteriaceae bacterium]|nr:response regulator [Acidobacteriaceae bacterium]
MNSTLLVVDDSTMMRKVILRLVAQAGLTFATTLEAADGLQAIELLRVNRPSLILCDINMPNLNGIELLREIQQQNLAPGVPIVMVTTENGESQVRQAIACGARGYLKKPFTADQIRISVLPLLTTP